MKVVHIVNHFSNKGGGVERVIYGMCGRASRISNFEFVVLSYGKKKETKIVEGLCVKKLKGFIIFRMSVLPSLLVDLIREKPDVIHVHVPYPYGLIVSLIAKTLLRKPIVVTYYTDPPVGLAISKIYGILEPILLRFTNVVLATSDAYKNNSVILRKLKNVDVLKLGINTENYFPVELPEENIILTVGRKTFYKNTDMLIQAMAYINEEFPDTKLLITGNGHFEKTANNITFLGYVSEDELLSLYHRCKFFVLPSTTNDEGFGLVLLESMACGKPAIVFDLWGPSTAIGDCGIVVKEKTIEALAKAMAKFMRDEELRKTLGQRARERVLKYFSLRTYDKITDVYRRITLSAEYE